MDLLVTVCHVWPDCWPIMVLFCDLLMFYFNENLRRGHAWIRDILKKELCPFGLDETLVPLTSYIFMTLFVLRPFQPFSFRQ